MTELHFKGKEFVYNHHLTVPHRPLVMDAAKGIGTPRLDGNLIIQGDNLHALKALLPTHAGKVDCIFIDPPYNTGNEGWAYNDNVNAPMIKEWLEANPIGIEDGLRHDKWCAMMWPRLRLLWELLAEEGTIFVCIDDNEAAALRAVMDEVWGREGFIGTFVWRRRTGSMDERGNFSQDHDYVVCYQKGGFGLSGVGRTFAKYANPDDDPRGPWIADNLSASKPGGDTLYAIVDPDTGREFFPPKGRYWPYNRATMAKKIAEGRIIFPKSDGGSPLLKRFKGEAVSLVQPVSSWISSPIGQSEVSDGVSVVRTPMNSEASKQIKAIFGDKSFQYSKPVELVIGLLAQATNADALVLDSFAGSGTTAHAVLEANRRDGGNRRFILVEMEDYADRLTAERVRRVINGYPFKGTLKTELHRESLTWAKLQKADRLTETVEKIETLHGHEYDRITKRIDGGELIVTGERTVDEAAPGLGGEFTYCTLGDPIDMDRILSGQQLPDFKALGTVLFHTATNQTCAPALMNADTGYLGEAGGAKLWLVYKPDLAWLKTPQAALTLSYAQQIVQADPTARHIVFAPANHTSPSLLRHHKITTVEFAPLPYALYRVERG